MINHELFNEIKKEYTEEVCKKIERMGIFNKIPNDVIEYKISLCSFVLSVLYDIKNKEGK